MAMMDGSGSTDTNRGAGDVLGELGGMLRRRREEIGQDLKSISAITHIRAHYLKAIEDGRRKELPGTAYMIGYLRTYADYLGFDGNRLIADYHDRLAGPRQWIDKRADPVEPSAISQIRISPAIVFAGLLVLGAAGYMAWGYATAPDQPPVETATVETPIVPVEPETPAVEPAPAASHPSPTGAEASAPAGNSPEAPAETEQSTPAQEPAAETVDQVPPEAEVASSGEEVTEQSPPQSENATELTGVGKIVIRARLESWVQVTNEKKEVLFSRVLRSGETYTVPEETGLMLTTGNAGGVEILVDGTKMKTLGTVGLVKRDIPLDPAKLKDGSAFIKAAPAPLAN